jgi:CRISPR-associated endonuclease/helicase Cas3
MAETPQALAGVNTKNDAFALLDALNDPDALHLSTNLCGGHRRAVIDEVKRRLEASEPCRLVSTQVVEAGVDLDFPVVLRALGPLSSVIQAAGRCNREGELEWGRVVVFRPAEGGMPPGPYTTAVDVTRTLLARELPDLHDPTVVTRFFQRFYDTVDVDAHGIQALRRDFEYPETARQFRLIDDDTESLIVTQYGDERQRRFVFDRVERLRVRPQLARIILRELQPYIVAVRRHEAARYRGKGFITELMEGVGVWHGKYDAIRGVVPEYDLGELTV